MRSLAAWLALLVAVAQAGLASQAPQASGEPPIFRAGTDLLTLEVSVVDGRGQPVQGLRPADFAGKIKIQNRRVVAAECVKAFKPKKVVPYHYSGSDPNVFADALSGVEGVDVILIDAYPGGPAF